jgi:hypothetical protein
MAFAWILDLLIQSHLSKLQFGGLENLIGIEKL